jgi:hypothetical protein
MIHIEKLSLKNVEKYSWQTFTDNFIGTKETRTYLLEHKMPHLARAYINSQILTPLLLPKLNNVTIGKFFNTTGLDIDILLMGKYDIKNLVIEISVDNINSLPKNKLKQLLEKYPVILNDFEEGGNLFGREELNLVKFLTDRNIKPKQLFLVGGCLQLEDYPLLNIHKIHYDYWMIISATVNQNFSNAIFNNNYKQDLLDRLENTPNKFCIIPMFKPRQHRLNLLSQLNHIDMLDKCDWSLALDYKPETPAYKSFCSIPKQESYNVEAFLKKYKFPKFLPNGVDLTWSNIISPNIADFNQYRFYLSAETYLGDEVLTPMGGCGFTTEKTFKSFLTGCAPIIYGPKEIDSYLSNIGFKTMYNTDSLNYSSVSNLVKTVYDTQIYEKDLIQHNFDLITNGDFLASQVASPLNKIAELINSIRR